MLDLSFESGEDSLSVRRFAVREALSTLFSVSIEARSPSEDLDFEGIVGKGASFRMRERVLDADGGEGGRLFRGICASMELLRVEPNGLSTYALTIVPALWLLSQRRNYRVFQHRSVPEIIKAILAEWNIEAEWRVDATQHPKLEYRVQYGESDLDFVSRLSEEAGITFLFAGQSERKDGPQLVFSDDLRALASSERRAVPFMDDPSTAAGAPFVTEVRLNQQVRPGRFTIRDFDFRRSPEYQLFAGAATGTPEARLEQYHYLPGSFVVETSARGGSTPVADGAGAARHDERSGQLRAERALGQERISRRAVAFRSNVDLSPGETFSLLGHPRADLAADKRLLVIEMSIDGTHDGEWARAGRAVFVGPEQPFLPPLRATKPRIHSVQSAVVVGPKGQEIHTDEFGRVRVQFHWDREGRFDEHSSCWIRVSQGWAGGAYGMVALPRLGQEVLIGFIEGDPDQPIVVGRVYNNTARVPYKLPESKTVSTWKSSSSPGLEGSNEIMFEDAKGAELVYMQAERNLEKLVKVDEAVTIGNNRSKVVKANETIAVGGSRTATIGSVDEADVGVRHAVSITSGAGATGVEMVDRRISWTTGEATITLEGPNITLEAAAGILLKAASDIALEADANITANATVNLTLKSGSKLVVRSEGGDVVIQGGPIVRINPEVGGKPLRGEDGIPISVEVPPRVDLEEEIEKAEEHARFDRDAPAWFAEMTKPGGEWDYGRLGERYAGFSNFHYGVMGKAMGFPEGALLRHAGMRRKARGDAKPEWGDPGNGVWGGTYPYGAPVEDQEMVKKGFKYYDDNFA
ncbi:type VI secretion system tip protein TssI/VgrG [Sorangium sp. So ce388]|uniref:type VI secretion system tip protein TssI/VgrG n=1 Tax=Sorangium sp. So ce388 TaxID=3133309 RepID=UPI003F5B9DC6